MAVASQLLIMEGFIENIIEEVEKRPALYKKSLKEYADVNEKKKLWQEVCEAVVLDWNLLSAEEKTNKGRDVQKKWANLRTCFRRELNAQKNTKSGQAAMKRRKYVYFEKLLFLLPCMENRRTEGNLEENDSLSNDDDDDQAGPSTSTPIRQRKKRSYVSKHTDVDEALLKALNEPSTDEDVNFAMSLVPSLRNLTAEKKLDAKISILNVFKQIRLARRVQSTSEPTRTYDVVQEPLSCFPIYITSNSETSPGNSNETAQSYYANFSDESEMYDL